ncbi:MAG: hypothetical protein ACQERG_02665 [Pseudomonadota bacterium]
MATADCLIFPENTAGAAQEAARTALGRLDVEARPAPPGGLHAFYAAERWSPSGLVAALEREGVASRAVAL